MEANKNGVKQALERADQALTTMEEILENKDAAPEILPMAQLASVALLRAFVMFRGEEPDGSNLQSLWNQCVALEAEFLEFKETMDYLTPEAEPDEDWDSEDYSEVLDAANELWDFVVGFLPENLLP